MDRDSRRDDRRRRDDNRDHKARTERERSRSPHPRERHDDRRRDRSPARGGQRPGSSRSDRDRDHGPQRGRDRQNSGTPPRRSGERGASGRQQQQDHRGNTNRRGADGRQDASRPDTRMQNAPEDEDSEAEMERIMGFHNFRTTKDTKVPGNDKNYAVHKVKKTEYRQYMNRVGGFNRPLSPTRI